MQARHICNVGQKMIVGNPATFAIESRVSRTYAERGLRALGFFVIHISGQSFGVRETEATLLGCSFDRVEEMIARRGSHSAAFALQSAGEIADAFRRAIYAPDAEQKDEEFGCQSADFAESFYSNHLIWAPDGDEAFDDGSYILLFDVDDRVRLIGFRCLSSGAHDPSTMAEVWVGHDEFYALLTSWRDRFRLECEHAPRVVI
jgi:hypothetical protein